MGATLQFALAENVVVRASPLWSAPAYTGKQHRIAGFGCGASRLCDYHGC
jgi:hypothetical protein